MTDGSAVVAYLAGALGSACGFLLGIWRLALEERQAPVKGLGFA